MNSETQIYLYFTYSLVSLRPRRFCLTKDKQKRRGKQSPWQDRSLGSLGMTLRVRLLRRSLPFAPRND